MPSIRSTSMDPAMAATQQCQKRLKECCWQGEISEFHQVFASYLKTWSHKDPHGRRALQAAFETGALSFQSFSTDRQELEQLRRVRWSAWLSVLPLDMQLNLILFESDPRELNTIDLRLVKWSQLSDIQSAPFTEETFKLSPLGGWVSATQPGPCSPKMAQSDSGEQSLGPLSWQQTHARVMMRAHSVATSLAAWKAWPKLEEWMELANIKPGDPLGESVYVHYRTQYSRGSTSAMLRHPLPFLAVGVFTGAIEPEFWQVMARCGGPSGPVLEHGSTPEGVSSALPEDFLRQPMSWIEPQAKLDPAAVDSIHKTAAAWRQSVLTESMEPASRPSVKPSAPSPRF